MFQFDSSLIKQEQVIFIVCLLLTLLTVRWKLFVLRVLMKLMECWFQQDLGTINLLLTGAFAYEVATRNQPMLYLEAWYMNDWRKANVNELLDCSNLSVPVHLALNIKWLEMFFHVYRLFWWWISIEFWPGDFLPPALCLYPEKIKVVCEFTYCAIILNPKFQSPN